MEHLVGDVGERNEVVLTAIDLPLIDLGKQWIMMMNLEAGNGAAR